MTEYQWAGEPFLAVMEDAGWLPITVGDRNPRRLAEFCLKAKFLGLRDFIFYCYYAFPIDFPEHIQRIFGRKYFSQYIRTEAIDGFRKAIRKTAVNVVSHSTNGFLIPCRGLPNANAIMRQLLIGLFYNKVRFLRRFRETTMHKSRYMKLLNNAVGTISNPF